MSNEIADPVADLLALAAGALESFSREMEAVRNAATDLCLQTREASKGCASDTDPAAQMALRAQSAAVTLSAFHRRFAWAAGVFSGESQPDAVALLAMRMSLEDLG